MVEGWKEEKSGRIHAPMAQQGYLYHRMDGGKKGVLQATDPGLAGITTQFT